MRWASWEENFKNIKNSLRSVWECFFDLKKARSDKDNSLCWKSKDFWDLWSLGKDTNKEGISKICIPYAHGMFCKLLCNKTLGGWALVLASWGSRQQLWQLHAHCTNPFQRLQNLWFAYGMQMIHWKSFDIPDQHHAFAFQTFQKRADWGVEGSSGKWGGCEQSKCSQGDFADVCCAAQPQQSPCLNFWEFCWSNHL